MNPTELFFFSAAPAALHFCTQFRFLIRPQLLTLI